MRAALSGDDDAVANGTVPGNSGLSGDDYVLADHRGARQPNLRA